MEEPFVIRLSVEHMKYQILQAISPREIELKERIELAVKKAVEGFDFQGEIERKVVNELNSMTSAWVRACVQNTIHTSPLQKQIQAEVERQLKEAKRS
jgi:hypothetical protein